MTTFNTSQFTDIVHRLAAAPPDYFPGICDPDFDGGLEELERQFAELRLDLAHGNEATEEA